MQAGRLRHRVSLQRLQETRDPETGAVVTDWVELDQLWAEVAPLSPSFPNILRRYRKFMVLPGFQSDMPLAVLDFTGQRKIKKTMF